MLQKLTNKLKEKKGFTLIEMIITISILLVLIGIGSVSIYGYMVTAYMNRVNETAKTVFLASQSYLTEQKQMGQLAAFNELANSYGDEIDKEQLKHILMTNDPGLDWEEYEKRFGTDSIRYIRYDETSGSKVSDNPIAQIVSIYLNDTKLLSNNFLLEYDTKTGVVRSVFYTEKSISFDYNIADERDKSSPILRDSDSLKVKRQGYYGVDASSLLSYDIEILPPKQVMLINGERLFLQFSESNYVSPWDIENGRIKNANEAFDDDDLKDYLVYDIEVFKPSLVESEKGTSLFKIEGISTLSGMGGTIEAADDSLREDQPIKPVLAFDSHKNTYMLLLDDIHHSIFTTYNESLPDFDLTVNEKTQAQDILYCEVKGRLEKNPVFKGESTSAWSNQQSAAYAGGEKEVADEFGAMTPVGGNGKLEEDGSSSDKEKAFSIDKTRHFNNMRFASNTSHFVQTASFDWKKPETPIAGGNRLYEKNFVPLVFAVDSTNSGAEDTFLASYYVNKDDASGKPFFIENITINRLTESSEKEVGIFKKIVKNGTENPGLIDGMHLKKASIQGAYYVGAITGKNAGTIQNIIIEDSSVAGSYFMGGITGKNESAGTLDTIQIDAKVVGTHYEDRVIALEDGGQPGWYIGGSIGLNEGNVRNVFTSILNAASEAAMPQKTVTGTAYVGGLIGANQADGKTVEKLTNFNNLALAEGISIDAYIPGNFGGVVGFNSDKGIVKDSINKGLLELKGTPDRYKRFENLGGIAGTNQGKLTNCSNALVDNGRVLETAKLRDCITKLKAGNMPQYFGTNVGGIAGFNEDTGQMIACDNALGVILGHSTVGGLVGKNDGYVGLTEKGLAGRLTGLVKGRAASASVKGLVIATGDITGGIFGSNNGDTVSGYTNYANIFGRSVAGGIIGQNGGGEYLFANSEPADYDALIIPFDSAKPDKSITSCTNYGFVYAQRRYSGGITGINLGKISACNSVVNIAADSVLSNALGGTAEYKKLAKADCVGGITGLNAQTGKIERGGIGFPSNFNAKADIYVKDFGGGIAGLNDGSLEGYSQIEGNIYGSGNYIGGFMGMNLKADAFDSLTINQDMQIYGNFFVGGLVGCNVAQSADAGAAKVLTIKGSTQNSATKRGKVTGGAYVGGIIGYNTYKSTGVTLAGLYESQLKSLVASAYLPYVPDTSPPALVNNKTVFKDCYNRTEVVANRYVGGIVGYNSSDAELWITGCINYASISIGDESLNKDKDYYFIGGITGRNSKGGIIDQCNNDGSVKSPSLYLGGLCEVNEGWVQYCYSGTTKNYNDVGISGKNSVGGLVGLNSNSVILCSAGEFAKVTGGNNTGGLVGTNGATGVISGDMSLAKALDIPDWAPPTLPDALKCISKATVTGTGENTGGIVGLNLGSLANIFVENPAVIIGKTNVGGFIGKNEGFVISGGAPDKNVIRGLINNARMVEGEHQVGGIVGAHTATLIADCINNGIVEATGADHIFNPKGYAGGITGFVSTGVTLQGCTNYGKVISNDSVAGGITGLNEGIVEECFNYGSLQGAMTRNTDNRAVGGIVGTNNPSGKVINCISGDNQSDPNKGQNPNIGTKNEIYGRCIVGGIIGKNKGEISNTPATSNINISLRTDGESSGKHAVEMGGISGQMLEGATNGGRTNILQGYTYSGTITADSNCIARKSIGGIIGRIESHLTVENCMFDGAIAGWGNNTEAEGGVGGIAGRSNGTIVVYGRDVDSQLIYSSSTKRSSIEGRKNVGGLTGSTGSLHKLKLNINGTDTLLTDIPANKDSDTANDIYYTNLATVLALNNGGGCYGVYGQNQLAYYNNKGMIKPHSSGGNSTLLGGILGSDDATEVTLKNCLNEGSIGNPDVYLNNATGAGGVIGRCNRSGTTIKDNRNKGQIVCGSGNLGGIAGELRSGATISNCINEGSITVNANNVGGISGYIDMGTINENTKNIGKVQITGLRKGNIGGIFGLAELHCYIKNVSNEGQIDNANGNTTGGIGGRVNNKNSNTIEMQNCINAGVVDGSEDVGGIIGLINSPTNFTFKNNENRSTVNGAQCTGGIAGRWLAAANTVLIDVSDCTNTGVVNGILTTNSSINNIIHRIGGTIGYLDGYVKINRFRNEGNVIVNIDNSAKVVNTVEKIGGIIGESLQRGSNLPFENCQNQGSLQINSEKSAVGRVQGIGGIIGRSDINSTLKNCTNKGNIEISNRINNLLSIGGIVGIAVSNSNLEACVNEGGFNFKNEANIANIFNVGGIVGEAGSDPGQVLINACINKANIDFSSNLIPMQSYLGGILGKGNNERVKLQYCISNGNVLGNTDITDNVGGIAGRAVGLVYSCSTENTTQKPQGYVSGRQNVGGLVGIAENENCKITSIKNAAGTGYEYSLNNFNVTGQDFVGGLVGRMQGGTLQTVSVSKDVVITLNNNASRVGGLVGSNDFVNGYQGAIANCYGFGQVKFASPMQYYLGGVTGFRARNAASQKAGAYIKHSFYLYDDNKYAGWIDESRPAPSVSSNVLAVGNEPPESYYQDIEDNEIDVDNLNTQKRYRWSKEKYQELYRALHDLKPDAPVPDDDKWDELETIQKHISPVYDLHKLPVPQTNKVTGSSEFNYNMDIYKIPGFSKEVKLYLYDGNMTNEEIEADTEHTKSLHMYTYDIGMDEQLRNITFNTSAINNYKAWVGKPVKVAIQAIGYSEEITGEEGNTQLIYTQDSDCKVVQDFIIMPPLLTPEIEFVEQDGALVTLKIKNWDAYNELNKPYADYPNLEAGKGIYEQYFNGFDYFDITDYYRTAENAANDVNERWTISKAAIKSDGTFTIDYTKGKQFESKKGSHKWHAWNIRAIAINRSYALDVTSVTTNDLYRYFSSLMGTAKYYVEAETKLKPPTNLVSNYKGGRDWAADIDTPSYELVFNQSISPIDAIKGYEIVIVNPANGKTVTRLITKDAITTNPGIYKLDKNTLNNELGIDMEPETAVTSLEWSMKTLKEDAAKYFLDSDFERAQMNIELPKKEKPVDSMSIEFITPGNPNRLKCDWSSEPNISSGGQSYTIKYKITVYKDGSPHVIEIEENTYRDKTLEIKLDALGAADVGNIIKDNFINGYTLEVVIVREGQMDGANVKTVHSNAKTYEKIYETKMKPVTALDAVFSEVIATGTDTTKEDIVYSMTFTNPVDAGADNCSGFEIKVVPVGEANSIITYEIPFDTAQPYELKIPIDKLKSGSNGYNIFVVTKSSGAAADSEPASKLLTITNERLLPPSNLIVTGIDADGEKVLSGLTDIPVVLRDISYRLDWTLQTQTGNGINNVQNQVIRLLDKDGNVLKDSDGNDILIQTIGESMATLTFTNELLEFAGLELLLEIGLHPKAIDRCLPSKPERIAFIVPTIKLEIPLKNDALTKITDKSGNIIPDGASVSGNAAFKELKASAAWTNAMDMLDTAKSEKGRSGQNIMVSCAGTELLQIDTTVSGNTVAYTITPNPAEPDISVTVDSMELESGQITLTNIPTAYQGKNLEFTIVSIPEVDSPTYVESDKLEIKLKLPSVTTLRKLDAVSDNNIIDPQATKEAEGAKAPTETGKPVATEKPREIGKPVEKEEPSETEKPKETERSAEMQKPEETEYPSTKQKVIPAILKSLTAAFTDTVKLEINRN